MLTISVTRDTVVAEYSLPLQGIYLILLTAAHTLEFWKWGEMADGELAIARDGVPLETGDGGT